MFTGIVEEMGIVEKIVKEAMKQSISIWQKVRPRYEETEDKRQLA